MDKETLSNYGWIVICVLVLAVMLALATPFGTFVADGFKATYTGLFQTGDNALDVGLNAVGVSNKLPCGHGRKDAGDHTQKECGHYNCQDTDCGCVPASCGVDGHWSGDGLDHTTAVNHTNTYRYKNSHTYACQCEGWIVPEGGTYYVGVTSTTTGDYTGATATYTAGQIVPCGIQGKDVYVYGDYEYKFSSQYNNNTWAHINTTGWGVRVLDDSKTEYGPILENINNKPITNLCYTFYGCTALTTAPVIPNTVKHMVKTFFNCTSLTTAPEIPSSVTDMAYTFYSCTNLKTYVDSTDPNGDFSGYVIPSDTTDMNGTFGFCTSLATAPIIPSNVKNLSGTFDRCTALTGTIYIHTNNITSTSTGNADGCGGICFQSVDMSKISLTGEASKDVLNLLGSTGKNWTPIE